MNLQEKYVHFTCLRNQNFNTSIFFFFSLLENTGLPKCLSFRVSHFHEYGKNEWVSIDLKYSLFEKSNLP